jgi:hypothetical protein
MKKQITGFIAALVLFVMYSYKTTNGDIVHETSSRARYNISIPLAQKNIIVTSNHDYVKKLIVKGYVCEDVDIVFFGAYSKSTNKKYYTMIKY